MAKQFSDATCSYLPELLSKINYKGVEFGAWWQRKGLSAFQVDQLGRHLSRDGFLESAMRAQYGRPIMLDIGVGGWTKAIGAIRSGYFQFSTTGMEIRNYDQHAADFLKILFEASILRSVAIEDELNETLKADGWEWDGKLLQRLEPHEEPIVELLSPLRRKVRMVQVPTKIAVETHIRDAESAWSGSDWKKTAAEYRNALEALIEGCALEHQTHSGHQIPPHTPNTKSNVLRQYLEREQFLSSVLKEKGCLDATYGLASNFGSHHGIINDDEAKVVRGMCVSMMYFIMVKWENWADTGYRP